MPRRRRVLRDWWTLTATVITLAFAAGLVVMQFVPSDRWVEIIQAVATDGSASRLNLVVDVCNPSTPLPAPTVVETRAEVRVSVDRRVKRGGDTASCATGATVTLRSPLDTRRVVDGHSGHQVTVIFTDSSSLTPGG